MTKRVGMTKDCSGYRVGTKVFCKKHGQPFADLSSTEPLYADHPPTKCDHPGCHTRVPDNEEPC